MGTYLLSFMGEGKSPTIFHTRYILTTPSYTPSLPLAVVGAVLFVFAALLHATQVLRYRTWYFTPILVGTIMEIVGYVCRALSAKRDPYSVLYFVLQYFFIVVAPVFFSAAIYTVLSVLINRLGRAYAPLAPRIILGVFIACDVVATIVQVAGAALIGTAESNHKDPTTANDILLAGLAFQVASFAVFIALMAVFLWRARAHVGAQRKSEGAAEPTVGRGFLVAFWLATLMVYLRTCFRLAETADGLQKYLSTHEAFFGCLEFAPIVVAVYALGFWHPGRCIPIETRIDSA